MDQKHQSAKGSDHDHFPDYNGEGEADTSISDNLNGTKSTSSPQFLPKPPKPNDCGDGDDACDAVNMIVNMPSRSLAVLPPTLLQEATIESFQPAPQTQESSLQRTKEAELEHVIPHHGNKDSPRIRTRRTNKNKDKNLNQTTTTSIQHHPYLRQQYLLTRKAKNRRKHHGSAVASAVLLPHNLRSLPPHPTTASRGAKILTNNCASAQQEEHDFQEQEQQQQQEATRHPHELIRPGAIRVIGPDGNERNEHQDETFQDREEQQSALPPPPHRGYQQRLASLWGDSTYLASMPIVAQVVEAGQEPPLVEADLVADEESKSKNRIVLGGILCWRYFVATCLVAIIVVLLVVLIPRRGAREDEPAPPLTTTPSLSPSFTPRVDAVFRLVSNVLGHEQVYTAGSIFQEAAFWMLDSDPLQLSIIDDNVNKTSQQEQGGTKKNAGNDAFIQRYALVLFYFMAGPWRTCNPLPSPLSSTTTRTTTADISFCFYERLRRQSNNEFEYEPENATRWLSATHECEWVGIQCRHNDNNESIVEHLELFDFEATGTLPTELGLLSHVKRLRLADNLFTGTIPIEYGSLLWQNSLIQLDLQNNTLTGSLPATLWDQTQLRSLNVGINRLGGTVPTEIGKLPNLLSLYLFENNFIGTLPSELGRLRLISNFRANNNAFVGAMPKELFISKILLGEIWLNNNAFSGPIPTEIGSVAFLSDLRLSFNQLTGTIPTTLFDLTNLFRFDLEFNQLKGRLDTMPWLRLERAPLKQLRLRENQIEGSIPTTLGSLTGLVELQLGRNFLTGTIPTEIGGLCNLRLVTFHYNQLEGAMPSQVCALARPFRLRILQADCAPANGINDTTQRVECPKDCCTSCCDPVLRECRLIRALLTVSNRCNEEFLDQPSLIEECIEDGTRVQDEKYTESVFLAEGDIPSC